MRKSHVDDLDPAELRRRESQACEAIGAFVFRFSQLEFSIRARLARALRLTDEEFDAVTASYDFAMLCTVTRTILTKKYPARKKQLATYFKKCHALNDNRKKIVHGLWSQSLNDGTMALTHVSRGSLAATEYFQNIDELKGLADEAMHLMAEGLQGSATGR